MRIAIIGAGNMGSALARACVTAGHEVVLSARHAEHAAKVAADVGAKAAGSNPEAVEGADMVVRPLDAGGLLAARALELMAILHISLNARNGWPWQSGWKLLGPTG